MVFLRGGQVFMSEVPLYRVHGRQGRAAASATGHHISDWLRKSFDWLRKSSDWLRKSSDWLKRSSDWLGKTSDWLRLSSAP